MAEHIVPARCPIKFDHDSLEHAENWPQQFQEIREQCPRAWTDSYGGFWIASKYKDIVKIAQRPDAFSTHKVLDPLTGAATGGASIPSLPMFRIVPNESESPEWNLVRSFLNRRFAPKASEEHRSKLKQWAAALIDLVIENGRFDLVDDIASPLPALITMDILGFPLRDWRDFATLFHNMTFTPKSDPGHPALVKKMDYFIKQRVDEEIEIRRCQSTPSDDLFSYMAHGTMNGQPLDREMIHSISFQLIGGGVDTTTSLTSLALVYLARNPKDRQRLIDEPKLIPLATEEFLRYFSPIHGNARTVKQDIEVDGWQFRRGERVMLSFASANRDAEVFDEPETVRLDRFPNRHIGFGVGMHRCLGSFLARLLFETMVTEVLTRMPDYQVVEDELAPYPSVAFVNGLIRAPATFTPGKRMGVPMPV